MAFPLPGNLVLEMAEKLVISCIKQEMYKSKRFSYSYEDYEDGDKNVSTMVEDIMGDSEFTQLEESFSTFPSLLR